MVKTLSSPSILSNKYGQFDSEQAQVHAKKIEEEAFSASQNFASTNPGDSGSHVLQFYSKEKLHKPEGLVPLVVVNVAGHLDSSVPAGARFESPWVRCSSLM